MKVVYTIILPSGAVGVLMRPQPAPKRKTARLGGGPSLIANKCLGCFSATTRKAQAAKSRQQKQSASRQWNRCYDCDLGG